jgi:hypothetical protein
MCARTERVPKDPFADANGSVACRTSTIAPHSEKTSPEFSDITGYTRILGALKNVGHQVSRPTIARILKAHGMPPVPERRTSWQTFLRAHWGTIAGADFFTTEVWTWRGLVTYYTVFVIDVASRRVHIVGSTPFRNDLFMRQVAHADRRRSRVGGRHRVLICDRDAGGARPCASGWTRRESASFRPRFKRPMRMPTRSGLCAPSNMSV